MAEKIKNFLPGTKTYSKYVEVFGGSGALLFTKEKQEVEIFNDVDDGLINFLTVFQNTDNIKDYINRYRLTTISRDSFNEHRLKMKEHPDNKERAWSWWLINRLTFSGRMSSPSWGYSVNYNRLKTFRSAVEKLEKTMARIKDVKITKEDYTTCIDSQDSANTIFYLDPPYVWDTRAKDRYKHELSDKEHKHLVKKILEMKGVSIISGYEHDIYKPLISNGYEAISINVACTSSRNSYRTTEKSRQERTEILYIHPKIIKRS